MKRDLSFLNGQIIHRIKRWIIRNDKWGCPFFYRRGLPVSEHRCDYCEKIFPGIKGRENPETTTSNCPCGHYEYRYVKYIAELIITKETQS